MLLLLTSSYPAGDDDYRGLFVKRFAERLCTTKRAVEVIAPVPTGHCGEDLARTSNAGRPIVRWLGRSPDDSRSFGRLYGADGMLNNLRRHPIEARHLIPSMRAMSDALCARAGDAEAVIAHWLLPSGLVAALAKPRHRKPVWIVCHSGGVRALAWWPRPARLWLGSQLVRHADLVSCVTPELRERLLGLIGRHGAALRERCRVLPMGVDVDRFDALTSSAEGRVVVVARLSKLKGVDRLIVAASRQRDPPPLCVVGDGPERARLERLAARLRLDVDFVGACPPSAVPGALDGCAFAVVPSRRLLGGRTEGLPTVALEALAAGLPLVATTCWPMPPNLASAPGVFRVDDSVEGIATGIRDAVAYTRGQPSGDAERRRAAVGAFDWQRIGAVAGEWASDL